MLGNNTYAIADALAQIQSVNTSKTQQNFQVLFVASRPLARTEDINATKTAALAGVNRNTVNLYFCEIRWLILQDCVAETAKEAGVIEDVLKGNLKLTRAILARSVSAGKKAAGQQARCLFSGF